MYVFCLSYIDTSYHVTHEEVKLDLKDGDVCFGSPLNNEEILYGNLGNLDSSFDGNDLVKEKNVNEVSERLSFVNLNLLDS